MWLPRLLLVSAAAITAAFAVRPMASYRALALGASVGEIGLIGAASTTLALVAAVPLGALLDRAGERSLIVAGCVILGLAAAALAAADSLLMLAGLLALVGLGQFVVVVPGHTMVANRSGRGVWDSRFGLYTAAAALGQALGPALAGVVEGAAHVSPGEPGGSVGTTTFMAATGIALLAAVVTLTLPGRSPVTGRRSTGTSLVAAIGLARHPDIVPALVVSGIVLAAVDVLVLFLPALGEARGLPVATVGLLLATVAGTSMLVRLFAGRLIDRFGRTTVMLASIGLPAVSLPVTAVVSEPWLLFGLLALGGLGLGLGQPLSLAWVALRTSPEMRGAAMSLRMGSSRTGQLVVPAGMGLVATAVGVQGIFWALGGLLACSAVVAFRTSPREVGFDTTVVATELDDAR